MSDRERSERTVTTAKRYRGEVAGKLNVPEPYGTLEKVFPDHLSMTEEYLLGDVMSRPGLTLRERSMMIITALVAVRLEGGLKGHMNWGLNVGLTREEVLEIVMQAASYGGWPMGVEFLRLIENAYPGFLKQVKESSPDTAVSGPRLTLRDRSMVTLASLVSNRFGDRLKAHMRDALNMGISRETVLEIIMQVTPFTGWPVGVSALRIARDVFALEPGGKPRSLRAEKGKDVPASDLQKKGQAIIQQLHRGEDSDEILSLIGEVSPDFLKVITEEHLFGEVWSRPGLTLRDRCLITLAVLIASRFRNELKAHVRYALNAGVSREQILETIMHIANYTCWGAGVEAVHVAGEVFSPKA